MEEKYRHLTQDEINELIKNNCRCNDWNDIMVASNFICDNIRNVNFSGKVKLGVFNKKDIVLDGIVKHPGIYNASINNCTIGSFCSIAGNVFIGGGNHPIDWVSTSPLFHTKKSVLGRGYNIGSFRPYSSTTIGNDVWIGDSVHIKGGVTIGDGSVIGMGSVVTHDIPPYEIWAGNPAKFIKKRFDDATSSKLLAIRWWDYNEKQIGSLSAMFNDVDSFLKNNDR